MSDFKRVIEILDAAVQGQDFAGHGAFWRSQTRDQFVTHAVFGRKLIAVRPDGSFDPDESNLVKALEGRAPFGSDLTPRPPGALFRRMPGGRPPVPPAQIQEIRDWIAAGCPDRTGKGPLVDEAGGGPASGDKHNAYWRDFDNWAMFNATPPTQHDIGMVMNAAEKWMAFAFDPAKEADWVNAIGASMVLDPIIRLEQRQRETVLSHYGQPVPLLTVLDGYEKFGDNSLPDDPLRPMDVRHNMNGPEMWFFWAAFVDACLRVGTETPSVLPAVFWTAMARAILLGMYNDGVFRGRFTVVGFSADAAGKQAMRNRVRTLPADQIRLELTTRFRESGFSPPA